jgi:hypothetical protein
MSDTDDIAIRSVVSDYFAALQDMGHGALLKAIRLPFTWCSPQGPQTLFTEQELIQWKTDLVASVRARTGMVRAAILTQVVSRLNDSAALVRMESARFGAENSPISRHLTGLLVYRSAAEWRISAGVGDLRGERPK